MKVKLKNYDYNLKGTTTYKGKNGKTKVAYGNFARLIRLSRAKKLGTKFSKYRPKQGGSDA